VIQTRTAISGSERATVLVLSEWNRFVTFRVKTHARLWGSGPIVYLFFEDATPISGSGRNNGGGGGGGHDGTINILPSAMCGHEGPRLVSAGEDSTCAVLAFYSATQVLGPYENGKMTCWTFTSPVPAVARMIASKTSGPIWISELMTTGLNTQTGLTAFLVRRIFILPLLAIVIAKAGSRMGLDFHSGQSPWRTVPF